MSEMHTDPLSAHLEQALGAGFHIERELGGGGMSRVFVAHDVALGRSVVVKVLPPALASGLSVERFRREMQIGAQLRHAHIVPVLTAGAGNANGEPFLYYTMPFIAGESLRQRIDRDGAVAMSDALRIWREVLDALGHAHAQGVVHRDVKPANILLDGSHAFITDFGIARVLETADDARVTATGVALGTPSYMAPEQALGEGLIDARVDVYAAGLLMYEMLSGRNPFAGSSTRDTILAQISRAPPPLGVVGVTPALADLVMRCIAKDPNARPVDARTVLTELDSAASSELAPLRASPARRRTVGFAMAALVGVAAIAGGAWLGRGRLASFVSFVASRPANDSLKVTIFVADVTHHPSDSTLARTYTDAVLSELARDSWIDVTPPVIVREMAQLYGFDPSVLTRDSLVHYAKRFRTNAYLVLGVSRTGSGYLFSASAVGVRDGNAIGTVQEGASDAASIPVATRRLARALRREVVANRALLPPTSQSFIADDYSSDAVRLYAEGLALMSGGPQPAAAERFGQVLAIDSTFAMAALNQSTMLRFSGAPASVWLPPLVSAYRHRMRVRSMPQREMIVAEYMRLTGRPQLALAAYESALKIPWLEGDNRNNLALVYENLRRVDVAASLFERSLDTSYTRLNATHANMVRALTKAGRLDSARAVVARMMRADSNAVVTRTARYTLASAMRNWGEIERLFAEDLRVPGRPHRDRAWNEARSLALMRGQPLWYDSLARANTSELRDRTPGRYLEGEMNRASVRVSLLGDTSGARAIIDSALARVSWSSVPVLDRPYALAVTVAGMTRGRAAASAFASEWSRETPAELRSVDSLAIVRAMGDAALTAGDAAEALRLYRLADADNCIVCTMPRLARAYDRLGLTDSARVVYERYVARPYPAIPGSELARAHRRLGEIYELRRDWTNAAKQYEEFVTLWADADPPLQGAVREARARLERIRILAR